MPKSKLPASFVRAADKQFAALNPIEIESIPLEPNANSPITQAYQDSETTEISAVTETSTSHTQELSKYLAELEELAEIHRNLSESRKTDNKWSLGMAYGTTPNFSMPAENYTLAPERGTFEVDDFTGDIGQETAYYAQIESTQHRHPLSFGLLTGLPWVSTSNSKVD